MELKNFISARTLALAMTLALIILVCLFLGMPREQEEVEDISSVSGESKNIDTSILAATETEELHPEEDSISKLTEEIVQVLNVEHRAHGTKSKNGSEHEAALDSERTIWYDSVSGRVLRYINSDIGEVPESLTYADGIQEAQALEIARDAIKALDTPSVDGLKHNDSKETIQLIDLYSRIPKDLQAASWVYSVPYEYKGVSVLGGSSLHFSAYDATLIKYASPNFHPPVSMDVNVKMEDAINAALDHIAVVDPTMGESPSASLLLVRPKDDWVELTATEQNNMETYVLCWDVSFEKTLDGHQHGEHVLVRATDGSIAAKTTL